VEAAEVFDGPLATAEPGMLVDVPAGRTTGRTDQVVGVRE